MLRLFPRQQNQATLVPITEQEFAAEFVIHFDESLFSALLGKTFISLHVHGNSTKRFLRKMEETKRKSKFGQIDNL